MAGGKKKFDPMHDSVKLITLHSSKGLEFPLVCMSTIGGAVGEEQVLEDEARLLYVAMTRATQELVMTHHEESVLGEGESEEGDKGVGKDRSAQLGKP